MLDDLDELRTFESVLSRGSLTAAAADMGVSLAVVSKRLRSLERRAGQRLIYRTTRRLSPTEEGAALLPHVQQALEALQSGEARLVLGRDEPFGTIRVSAPVSLGRLHVAPVLAELVGDHAALSAELVLDDRLIDLLAERIDVAVRIGPPQDSSFVIRKLADSYRILVAAPSYLDRRGRPRRPDDLSAHACLRTSGWTAPWTLAGPDHQVIEVLPVCRLQADNGEVVADWAVAGAGITLKSAVDVAHELRAGRLERVLPHWRSPDAPIYALLPSGRQPPARTRLFLDRLGKALKAATD